MLIDYKTFTKKKIISKYKLFLQIFKHIYYYFSNISFKHLNWHSRPTGQVSVWQSCGCWTSCTWYGFSTFQYNCGGSSLLVSQQSL